MPFIGRDYIRARPFSQPDCLEECGQPFHALQHLQGHSPEADVGNTSMQHTESLKEERSVCDEYNYLYGGGAAADMMEGRATRSLQLTQQEVVEPVPDR